MRTFREKKWDQQVAQHLEKMNSNPDIVMYFERKFDTNGHVFGNVVIKNSQGTVKSVGEIISKLLHIGEEVRSATFERGTFFFELEIVDSINFFFVYEINFILPHDYT